MTDPYATLRIARNATPALIEAAFNIAVRTIHPDVGGGRDDFEALVEAKSLLLDPARRRRFDETGAQFDERTDDAIVAAAGEMLVGLMHQAIDELDDVANKNVLKLTREVIDNHRLEVGEEIKRLTRQRVKAKTMRLKMKKGPAASGVVLNAIDMKAAKIELEIRNHQDELRKLDAALVILSGYTYEVDKRPAGVTPAGTIAWTA